MAGAFGASLMTSNPEHLEHDGKHRVSHDHEQNRRHHGRGRRPPPPRPTPAALRSACNPRRHPDSPMMSPNAVALITPEETSDMSTIVSISTQYAVGEMDSSPYATAIPPRIPSALA